MTKVLVLWWIGGGTVLEPLKLQVFEKKFESRGVWVTICIHGQFENKKLDKICLPRTFVNKGFFILKQEAYFISAWDFIEG